MTCMHYALSIGSVNNLHVHVCMMANKEALFVMLVDRVPLFEAHFLLDLTVLTSR
jgi:hypothetical protein